MREPRDQRRRSARRAAAPRPAPQARSSTPRCRAARRRATDHSSTQAASGQARWRCGRRLLPGAPPTTLKATTPAITPSAHSHLMSKANTCAISVVPTSAPSITASATGSAISPWPANEESNSAVAVALCSTAVTAAPMPNAVSLLLLARADGTAQMAAKGARHAGPHHAHAPEQQGDGTEQGQQQFTSAHLILFSLPKALRAPYQT